MIKEYKNYELTEYKSGQIYLVFPPDKRVIEIIRKFLDLVESNLEDN